MKNILLASILLTLLSCENKKDECRYVTNSVPIDTSLYMSFSINNIDYRFYEFYGASTMSNYKNTGIIINGQTIFRTPYPFLFGNLNSDISQAILTFHDTTLQAGGLLHQRALRKRLQAYYKFTIPKQEPIDYNLVIADTIFLRGVSLSINDYKYSTDSLVSHFKFNIDSLSEYLWNDSYFRIKKNENACGWDRLIEGEFATSVMKVEDKKLVKVKNGRFRIVVYK
jgi:hypothetical protein